MSRGARFTGERLHEGDPLFEIDLARHEAAYRIACERHAGGRLLDLGCGSGAGAALLAGAGAWVAAVDRVQVASAAGARFCRADLGAPPFRARSFDTVTSFQVIEHFADPEPHLRSIAELLRDDGLALLTTPNRARSNGVNPFHAREYLSGELRDALTPHFSDVQLLGVGTSAPVDATLRARADRIRRLLRLDPLGLREHLPAPLTQRLFALAARFVRIWDRSTATPTETTWRDFPVGPPDDATSLDWLAVCRAPKRGAPAPGAHS